MVKCRVTEKLSYTWLCDELQNGVTKSDVTSYDYDELHQNGVTKSEVAQYSGVRNDTIKSGERFTYWKVKGWMFVEGVKNQKYTSNKMTLLIWVLANMNKKMQSTCYFQMIIHIFVMNEIWYGT